MRDNGIRRAAVFTTSAWGGYSSCTQYIEDIARGRPAAGDGAPELVKLRQYFDHPLFVEMFADGDRRRGRRRCPPSFAPTPGWCSPRTPSRSRPTIALRPDLYARQVAYASRLVATRRGLRRLRPGVAVAVRAAAGAVAGTRCGRPSVGPRRRGHQGRHRLPDRLRRRPHRGGVGSGQRAACNRPSELGIAFARAATPNADRRFARLAVDLIDELREGREPSPLRGPDRVGQRLRCTGFRSTARCARPECGKPSAKPSAGSR